MKYNKFILPLAACAFLFTGCVDEVMEWQEPDGTITEADIPLQDQEALALYKSIKEYAAEYTPDMKIGLGLGADLYIEDAAYRAIADENFQMFTTGNAMKHSSVVKANGDLNFATIDAFMALVPSDVEVYGHNFLWHTQQKQQYLKSLIAPEMKVEVPQGEKCENVVTNGGFENGTNGWMGFWGKYTYAVEQPGHDSSNAIHFTISPECANMWDAQLFWTLDSYLEPGVTYYYEFYVKSDSGLVCQFIGQNASNSGIYKDQFTPGTDWTFCSGEFTHGETDLADIERVGLQFGGEPGSQIWFDDFKFGKKIEAVEQEPMINIVGEAGTFESGTIDGWGAWSNDGCTASISDQGKGYNSDYSMKLNNPVAGETYSAQAFYALNNITWEAGDVYVVSFFVKTEVPYERFQVQLQRRADSYPGGGYREMETPAGQWVPFQQEIEITEEMATMEITHFTINFGEQVGDVYIDDFKFGEKNPEYGQGGDSGPINYCENGSFEDGLGSWTAPNSGAGVEVVELSDAINGKKAVKLTAKAESANDWDLQLQSPSVPVMAGQKARLSFYIKSDHPGFGRVSFSSDLTNQYPYMNWTGSQDSWTKGFETSANWLYINVVLQDFNADFVEGSQTWTFNFDLGTIPDVTYWIDDVRVEYEGTAAPAARMATPRPQKAAPTITYIYKTAEEKKALLLGAMESWIKQMAEHLPTVKHWDVINEPIMDGSNAWRGIDNVFNGEDTAPVENEGLTLNWASDHWYWGYYIGKEYASKAFEYARQYCGADAKLFVNDYNLETSPGKLQALIEFAKYIDENNSTGAPLVDGIGTQMHVTAGIEKEKVDAMFQTMAKTGKLVRVTELDVQVGTTNPTAEELLKQAETYKMIVESYKENVPAGQQSGITIWTLSDNAAEHEFWLEGDAPNLFDGNYGRKLAYKYFCDGLAGKNIAEEFDGLDWKELHETEEEAPEEGTDETPEEGEEETPAE